MTAPIILGMIPIQIFFDNSGLPLVNGYLNFREALNNTIPKEVFRDPAGLVPYENPLQLSDAGKTSAPIYFATDALYEIWVQDSNFQRIDTVLNYTPPGNGDSPITVGIDQFNHFLNPQMAFPLTIPAPLPANTPIPFAQGGWQLIKSNTAATDTLAMVPFTLGQTQVPGQPRYYGQYQCTSVGAGGETFKDVQCRICTVDGFNGDVVTITGWVQSPTSSQIECVLTQYFGTGGSPSTTATQMQTINCTPTWTLFSLTFNITSLAGTTIGTNGDDSLIFALRMPLNQISIVNWANFQWVHGTMPPPFEHQTDEYIGALVKGNDLPFAPQAFSPSRGMAVIIGEDGEEVFGIPGAIGEVKMIAYDATEDTGQWSGWLKINSSTVRLLDIADYTDLYNLLGVTWGGDGMTTFGLPPLGNSSMIAENTVTPTRAIGATGGVDSVTLTTSNLPALNFVVNVGSSLDSNSGSHLGIQTGGGQAFSVKNPFCVMCAMIKY